MVYYTNNGDGAVSDGFAVIDGDDNSVVPFTVTVQQANPSITTTTLPGGSAGTAYSQTLAAGSGTTPYSWSLSGGSLPSGLSLSSAGVVSGTPTQAGTFSPTFQVTDSAARTATRAIALTIAAPTILASPTTLPGSTVGAAYSQTVSATGGTAPYAYAITAGALPAGVALSTAGTLSGTPTTSGSFNFTLTATDAGGFTGSRAYTVAVGAPTMTLAPATLPSGTAGAAYSQTVSASGGTAPYAYAITAGAPPAGLTLDSSGVLSGTPTAGGTSNFTVTATDSSTGSGAPFSSARTYALSIAASAVVIGTATVPNATAGTAYSQTLAASGGTAPYTYAITAGALPAGLSLSAAGTLSGTPTAAGSSNFTATVTDSGGAAGNRSYTLVVDAPTVSLAPATLPNGTTGTAYNQTVSATGGTAPYNYTITAGALPTGLSLSTAGILSGTPTAVGSLTFTVTATETGGGFTGSRTYTLTIGLAAPVTSNVTASVAANSSATPVTLSLSGGAATSVAVASPASHGTAAASGTSITYTPAPGYSGADSFTYTASNSSGISAPATVSVTVNASVPGAPTIGAAALGDARASVAFTAPASNGGSAATDYTVTSSPGGITATGPASPIIVTGLTNGTSYTFTVTAANGAGTGPASAASNAVTPMPALAAPVASNVTASVAANSSANPITLALSGGMAASVAVASTASHGTATASGTSITYAPTAGYSGADSFTYTATNASGTSAPAAVSITVTPPTIALSPAAGSLPVGTVGTAYRQAISATGGTAPYGFAVSSGTLPTGLRLDISSGTISGTPTTSGPASFAIAVTDANGAAATASYTIAIKAQSVAFTFSPPPGRLPGAMAGEAYRTSISATGGTGTRIYSLASGSLPNGLVLNISTGELNGPLKASTEGDYEFVVAITDGTGATGSAAYSLRVGTQTVRVTDKTVNLAPGEMPGNVYLNAGATGSPFVRADVVRVNPANAGTAQIIEGEVAALEAVRPRGFYLKFTPNPTFAGTATIDFTLTSALGVSNIGTVSYVIALDRAVLADKANRAVRDFVEARQALLSNHVTSPGLLDRRLASQASERATLRISPSGNGAGLTVATSTAQLEAARRAGDPAAAETSMPLFNVWFNGMLLAHKEGSSLDGRDDPFGIDEGTGDDNGWGTFALLSAGVDYLVSDRLLLGVAAHSDRMTDPGKGTQADGTGVLVGPYASVALSPNLYLNASLLYGQSWNSVDLGGFEGSFDTTRVMATTKLEGLLGYGALTLRPNLKLNYLTEKVDDYDVSGDAATVAVEGFTQDDLRFSAGMTIGYAMTLPNGWSLSPELGGSLGVSSASGSDAIGDSLFGTVESGFALTGGGGWSLQAMGTLDLETEGTRAVGGRVSLSVPF